MGSTTTKRSLTKLSDAAVSEYIADKEAIVYDTGNGVNFNGNCINPEEAGTLIIHCLCLLDIQEKGDIAHDPHTDVFALMILHFSSVAISLGDINGVAFIALC